ncbi:MAG: glycosyltransferase family A protein [Oscillospiraceae bacterium]|nr:glycosyltransferase family A protein [Oscillospiraceae bacterium]
MKPIASVLVPLYNAGPFISRCLDSLRAQSCDAIEILVLDDGSTDAGPDIVGSHALQDRRIKLYRQKNAGVARTRNRLIELAQAEYLCFVDADDFVHPRYVELLLRAAREQKCALAMCKYEVVTSAMPDYAFPAATGANSCVHAQELIDLIYSKAEVEISILCSKLYERALFDGIRIPPDRIYEDGGTTYRLLHKAERIAVCEDTLYAYYMSDNSIMRSGFSDRHFDYYTMLDERLTAFSDWGCEEAYYLTQRRYCFKILDDRVQTKKGPALQAQDARLAEMYKQRCRQLLSNPRAGLPAKIMFRTFGRFPGFYAVIKKYRYMG